jgi:hypothetical protein
VAVKTWKEDAAKFTWGATEGGGTGSKTRVDYIAMSQHVWSHAKFTIKRAIRFKHEVEVGRSGGRMDHIPLMMPVYLPRFRRYEKEVIEYDAAEMAMAVREPGAGKAEELRKEYWKYVVKWKSGLMMWEKSWTYRKRC